ncbi:MAG: hypothetical protein SVY53_11850, partial [Chloroflexota bacterium]|nr:hypothetical protein [Chloroflexota bacterium]
SIPLSQSDLLALGTFYMILLHLLGVQLNCRPKDHINEKLTIIYEYNDKCICFHINIMHTRLTETANLATSGD